ncbi:MAG: protein-L-isoaspartate(D-aspartate) O-methyltransferase [Gemmatimonadales bacterium]|jgi:protein-L-isoaspartate(D-aspartate) O-methyltransferase
MTEFAQQRRRMVERDLAGRGIRDERVLEAMGEVPREAFVPPRLREFAYEDSPLPIEAGQTISQPYIVARMIEALDLEGGETVLDIGTGSGYAAAVLSRIADHVYTIERHGDLHELARRRFAEVGYYNIEARHGDGTLGWPEAAPFDAIQAAAGGPEVPRALLEQLKDGGRLVIPIGETLQLQHLVRVVRHGDEFTTQKLEPVRFVPLIGEGGWREAGSETGPESVKVGPIEAPTPTHSDPVVQLLSETVEPISGIDDAEIGGLLERIGDARVVLLGEATHGTSEFYRMRAKITRALVEQRDFDIVAAEADWPDAARVDRYVRGGGPPPGEWTAFSRFPTWMWRNREFREFVDWLHEHNAERPRETRTGFYGLDLYSLYRSIDAVLGYLDRTDPETARVARARYGCLSPWERDPAVYGRAALTGKFRTCEDEVVKMLRELLEKQIEYARLDGEHFLDAVQNARVVANAERYYRIMYYGSRESWNLRDTHMFDTLRTLLAFHGPEARAVVWEHNSHIGNAAATEMGARGEHNIGQLSREHFGDDAFLVGFGTDHGTVAAASDWDGPMHVKNVRPAHERSYERLFHETGIEAGLLHLRDPARDEVREELGPARLERAIGVIYRPETELQSHYFQASLPWQFDEYVWFDRTEAVRPLGGAELEGVPDTYPFGL